MIRARSNPLARSLITDIVGFARRRSRRLARLSRYGRGRLRERRASRRDEHVVKRRVDSGARVVESVARFDAVEDERAALLESLFGFGRDPWFPSSQHAQEISRAVFLPPRGDAPGG